METRARISAANSGKRRSPEVLAEMSGRMLGKHHSIETRAKIGKSHLGKPGGMRGRHHSIETRAKMSKTRTGKPGTMLGKHHTAESRLKASIANSGEKSYLWRGGISFAPYSTDWTRTLRRSTRERDHYVCRLCGEPQCDAALDVHHIDYVKAHCDPTNLVSLCHRCHMKTQINREFWTSLFQSMMSRQK